MPLNMRTAFIGISAVVAVLIVCSVPVVFILYPSVNISQILTMSGQGSSSPASVVVIGGGLAGLTATIEACSHGAKVTIVEKEKGLGGNSAKATSGINGVGTEAQKDLGIEDSLETFVKDTFSSADDFSDEALVRTLGQNSAAAHEWLKSLGLNLTSVVQLGGHSTKRTHRFPPTPEGKPVPVGFTVVSTLKRHIETNLNDSVRVLTNCVFGKVIVKDGNVVGVKCTSADGNQQEVMGTVIFASGGYANDHTNRSLLEKYRPDLSALPTTNGPWATGDILKVVEDQKLGAELIHMDKVQIHPTGFVEPDNPTHHTKFLAPEALRGCGAILIDDSGKRFVNELGRRDYVTDRINEHCKPFQGKEGNPITAVMLLTEDVINKFGPPAAGFYKFKGLIQDVGTLQGAAEKMGVDLKVLEDTITDYNAAAEKGVDEFGKKAFPTVFSKDDHFLIAHVTPSLHYCMGGLRFSPQAEVLTTTGTPIKGLYAAGEVTGGLHGNNRLGGNSLLECLVFGRIAGYTAAHYASQSSK